MLLRNKNVVFVMQWFKYWHQFTIVFTEESVSNDNGNEMYLLLNKLPSKRRVLFVQVPRAELPVGP